MKTYRSNMKFTFFTFLIILAGCGGGGGSNVAVTYDTTAPTITNFIPANAATGVGVSDNITLTFNEPVVARSGGTIELMTDYAFGHKSVEIFSITDTKRIMISGNVVTIDPTNNLLPDTGYHIGFNNALSDTAGNAFALPHGQYNFTTAVSKPSGY
jgi:hypothetical protein